MPFPWPTVSEIYYRLWRLKRLIAACAVIPLIFFAFMALIGFGSLGTGTVGLLPIALVTFLIIAGHAVLFPNSNQETAALSLTLIVLAIVGPLIAGSIFGWFLFLLFTLFMIWSGQNRILTWQTSTSTHSPTFKGRIRTKASLDDARQWFPLRPGLKRGQFTCGLADEKGRFPVWFDTGSLDWLAAVGIDDLSAAGITMPKPEDDDGAPPVDDGTASFYAEIEIDEPDFQRTAIVDDSGDIQSVVEHRFKATTNGCVVTEADNAAAFPWANSMFLWLADFQTDGLIHLRKLLEDSDEPTIRSANKLSLLALFSGWIMKRFMFRGATPTDVSDAEMDGLGSMEVDTEKLTALLHRLGPDYQTNGFTNGPMPLVTLEEFFEGNGDDGSFQGALLPVAKTGLTSLRDRADVADVRLGITQWEGPQTWPLAEYVYVVTSAQIAEVKSWFRDAKIFVSEVDTQSEHRKRDALDVPPGHQVVWAWID